MKYLFAPGCALILYKPHLVTKLHEYLKMHYGPMELLLTCCRHTPLISSGTTVINICPGCDRRYRENYQHPSTVSLWELLLENDFFVFPNYQSQPMTIIDACPTRDQDRIHASVRAVANKMNITVEEPANTKKKSTCCGDTFFGVLPSDQVIGKMKEKADEMPAEDVIVYCVSCSKSMFIGGKIPRYMIDLLFAEETVAKTYDPDKWHEELDLFIENHKQLIIKSGL